MSYVIINGDTTHYNATEIVPFTTQHGFDAIRIVGDDIPETNKGFKFYDDNDKLISDLSTYTNVYRQNEYSVQKDIIVPPKGTDAPIPPSPFDQLNSRVSRNSSNINKCGRGINENQSGILDVAELADENNTAVEDIANLADENSTAIEDLAAYIGELEERVAALEAKEE